jgi:hypothetical protein
MSQIDDNDKFSFNFSFKMKDIFKKEDEDQNEDKGTTEFVSFSSLVCHIIFKIKNIEYF